METSKKELFELLIMKIKISIIAAIIILITLNTESQNSYDACGAADQIVSNAASKTKYNSILSREIFCIEDGQVWISRTDKLKMSVDYRKGKKA